MLRTSQPDWPGISPTLTERRVTATSLLAPPLSNTVLIAAVLCYRAVYYWAPLAVAAALYLLMEANAKKLAATTPDGQHA